MPDGCRRAGAPWAAEYGWGYGGIMTVRSGGANPEFAVVRRAESDTWELQAWRGDTILGAWRRDPNGGQCGAAGPLFEGDRVQWAALRQYAPSDPIIFEAVSVPELLTGPQELFRFDHPAPAWPEGWFYRTERLLVVDENEGGMTVADLGTGESFRPTLPTNVATFGNIAAFEDTVFFYGYNYALSGLWTWTPAAGSVPLLKDDTYSYDMFDTDGADLAWIRSEGFLGPLSFQSYELWTSPFATNAADLMPSKVADLDLPGMVDDALSVGEGWVSVWFGPTDTRLYNLATGEVRRLPIDPGVSYQMGTHGLVIRDGDVWVKSFPTGAPGNDVRWITVFDLSKLPPG